MTMSFDASSESGPLSVLIATIGPEDPFRKGLVAGGEWTGPILSLAQARPFGKVIVLAAAVDLARAGETAGEVSSRLPGVSARVADFDRPDQISAALEDVGPASHVFLSFAGCSPDLREKLRDLATRLPGRVSLLDMTLPEWPGPVPPAIVEHALPRRGTVREPPAVYSTRAGDRGATHESSAEGRLDRAVRKLGIRAEHPAMRDVLETAAALAGHRVPVLIEGETGTGKTLMARLIHELSGRPSDLFVQINCGALPEKLIESALFGHRKGAFTGATDDQPGKFELADGGTLFLDEIGELPLELQPKFLKVLEDGWVEPVGARKGRKVDVRIIAATNRDLKHAIEERAFREDLYYRLSFGVLRIPPLRERASDVPPIALKALAEINKSLRHPKQLSPGALARLERQPWRGNVRDLENVIGRSALLSARDILEADDLLIEDARKSKDPLSSLPVPHEAFSLEDFLDSARKQLMLKALELAGGSQTAAARLLGISPQAVHKFLKSSSASFDTDLNPR